MSPGLGVKFPLFLRGKYARPAIERESVTERQHKIKSTYSILRQVYRVRTWRDGTGTAVKISVATLSVFGALYLYCNAIP
jgi:hypothetical protein